MTALHWLMEGYGYGYDYDYDYDITVADVLDAYTHSMSAAENSGHSEQMRRWIAELVARKSEAESFVSKVLSHQLSQTGATGRSNTNTLSGKTIGSYDSRSRGLPTIRNPAS